MMQILVVVAHPDQQSFNRAIADLVVHTLHGNGHGVSFHDLYAEGFDPILRSAEIPRNGELEAMLETHCAELAIADGIVIVHPNWWGQPPAILKGWIDRAFRPGVAYEFQEGDRGEGIPVGLLKADVAIIFNTSNTPEQRECEVFGDPLETLWKNCIFGLCGVPQVYRKMFGVIVTSSPEQREKWLHEVREMVHTAFPSTSS